MKLARIIERVTLNPWMITPAGYAAIQIVLDAKLSGADLSVGANDYECTDVSAVIDRNGIAQILINGTLGQRLSMLEKVCGGADYLDIETATNEAIEEGAMGILYQFDSPGGAAKGCPETAAFIAGVEVPKVAFTDGTMASAAYFLGSSCDYIVASETAETGSIGVIVPWVDKSRMWEMTGLKFDPIVSEGDTLKGAMFGPSLTPEQRDHFQTMVNDMGALFRGHVSQYRDLDYTALKAGAYSGVRALDLNLVDAIGSYGDAYQKLVSLVDKKGKA